MTLPNSNAADFFCREIENIVDSDDANHFLSNIHFSNNRKKNCQFQSSIKTLNAELKQPVTRSRALEILNLHLNTLVAHTNLASPQSIESMIQIVKKLSTTEKSQNKERSKTAYRALRKE